MHRHRGWARVSPIGFRIDVVITISAPRWQLGVGRPRRKHAWCSAAGQRQAGGHVRHGAKHFGRAAYVIDVDVHPARAGAGLKIMPPCRAVHRIRRLVALKRARPTAGGLD